MERLGLEKSVKERLDRLGGYRNGVGRKGRNVEDRNGQDWSGVAGMDRIGWEGSGMARTGWIGVGAKGSEWTGAAGRVGIGPARNVKEWIGRARQDWGPEKLRGAQF
jgi:hypothetical protein